MIDFDSADWRVTGRAVGDCGPPDVPATTPSTFRISLAGVLVPSCAATTV